MKIAVSACLLGENCKYNGGNNLRPKLLELLKGHEVIPVCPERLSGLGCPRVPVELVDGIAINADGENVHNAFLRGVHATLAELEGKDISLAVLQPRSPSCGVGEVYDGTFSRRLIPGMGLFAAALVEAGVKVMSADEFEAHFAE